VEVLVYRGKHVVDNVDRIGTAEVVKFGNHTEPGLFKAGPRTRFHIIPALRHILLVEVRAIIQRTKLDEDEARGFAVVRLCRASRLFGEVCPSPAGRLPRLHRLVHAEKALREHYSVFAGRNLKGLRAEAVEFGGETVKDLVDSAEGDPRLDVFFHLFEERPTDGIV